MRHGLTLPIFGHLADPSLLADLAAAAEDAGWDGVFVWDHVYYREPVEEVTDPWIALAAMAERTSRVTMGPMVTPLARRRPQVVARQAVALDHLSGGRLVLGVGLGLDGSGGEFERFGEITDVRGRAAVYDEALELLVGLLSGEPIDHDGPHHRARDVRFLPRPVNGAVPIWVGARWPNRGPLRRATRHQGVFLLDVDPEDLGRAADLLRDIGDVEEDFDVVVQIPAGAETARWRAAGATWCLSTFDAFTVTPADVGAAIDQGPLR